MPDRKVVITLVVIIGVLLSIIVVQKKNQPPIPEELLAQQTKLLLALNNVDQKLGGPTGGPMDSAGLTAKVQNLEQKINHLESEWNSLKDILVQAKAAGERAAKLMDNPDQKYDIAVGNSYVRGPKDAPITITEFVDFQCPFCARFHAPIVDVLKAYPDKVNYVLKNFPLSFHPRARPAAKAALAAGEQGKYYEMADLILENNRDLSDEKFQEYAKQLGLNMDKFQSDLKEKDAKWEKTIEDDMTFGEQVNVEGTPTFYINGRKTNARDLNSFKREIDTILNQK